MHASRSRGGAHPSRVALRRLVTAAVLALVIVATPAAQYARIPSTSDPSYDIVLIIGQSNAQGDSGGAVSPTLDPTNPRVYSFGASGPFASTIVLASDPLAHRGGGGTVVGPAMSFARAYADSIPAQRRVLVVPAAANATAFGSGTARWDPDGPLGSNNLYEAAIRQTLSARAAVPQSRIAAVIWVQGESDILNTAMPAATYRTYLLDLIGGLRERLETPELPFLIGSMVPEFIGTDPLRVAIDAVHRDIPDRIPFTAYVAGPRGMQRGDDLHYSPAGQREVGRRMFESLASAQYNAGTEALPDQFSLFGR
jgi:lysophospholipase L1-like esterase